MCLTVFKHNPYYQSVCIFTWFKYMKNTKDRGPGVFIPPPLIFIAAVLIGYLMDAIYPLAKLNSYFWLLLGSTGIILCIGVLGYALMSFIKAKTHIEPWQPASQLITTGLYRYSRNPIYLTFFIFTLCLGLVLSKLWIILMGIPALWVMNTYVIAKEEAYLEATFLDKYIKYKREVRRWI